MTFAANMQSVASRLLTSYGQAVTFSRETQGVFVPSTGQVSAGTSSTYTAVCYPSQYRRNEIDGINILTTDTRLITYTSSTPAVHDTVSLNSQTLRVMDVQQITAQGSNVLYILQCRV